MIYFSRVPPVLCLFICLIVGAAASADDASTIQGVVDNVSDGVITLKNKSLDAPLVLGATTVMDGYAPGSLDDFVGQLVELTYVPLDDLNYVKVLRLVSEP